MTKLSKKRKRWNGKAKRHAKLLAAEARLGQRFSVNNGVVTGSNGFYSDEEAE